MKKGLHVTLMTVAMAVLAAQAMAMAPAIADLPSPIVGSVATSTHPVPFVYPDAFDLDQYVTDDTTSPANIRWSYAVVGTPIYRINNVDPVTVGTDNIIAPGAKRINGSTDDPNKVDTKTSSITVRNVKYAPISGTGQTPSGSGIIDTQVVTLFASDGSTYSQQDVMFYTDNGGTNRLSPGGPPVTTVYQPDLTGTSHGWTYQFIIGSVTSSSGSTGVCLNTALTGDNFAGWQSPWGTVPLTANTVYRARARVNGSQSGAGTVPFFDFVIDNFDGTNGLNLFGGDLLILDNEGGANAAYNKPSTSGTTFTWVWAPSPMANAAWNDASTGVFAASTGNNKNARFQFRVLDVNANPGITANNDVGTICLNSLTIESIPYSALSLTQKFQVTDLNSGTFQMNPLLGSTVAYSGGDCTLSANTSASQDAEYAQGYPGDNNLNFATPSTLTDNYPIQWQSNKLLQVVFDLSAPNTAAETTQYDVFWTSMDAATNELIIVSYVTGAQNRCGMPKAGTPQQWMVFLHTNTETLSGVTEFHRFRPRIEFGNAPSLVFPGTTVNSGPVVINGVTVNEVSGL